MGDGKRIKRCSCSQVPVLPIDIINEILCRLPVEPLLRFKSVCKLWYSLIKNPNFIITHYKRHCQTNRTRPLFQELFSTCDSYRPIAFNPDAKTIGSSWPLVAVDPDDQKEGTGGNLLFSYYVGMPKLNIFLRPVNGFMLILRTNHNLDRCRMAMLNPATRQFRFLIDFEFNSVDRELFFPLTNHLFGYGICKNGTITATTPHVYKVVWLNIPPTQSQVIAKVYTVGGGTDGCWRIMNAVLPINFVYNYTILPHANICMNGKCYWMSRDFAHILAFDMDEEVFREMKSPVTSVGRSSRKGLCLKLHSDVVFSEVRCFGSEGDSLALFIFEHEFIDLSVMDKEEEWHWLRRIVTYIERPIRDFLNPLMHPQLPITDSILLKAGYKSFALYNPKTNRCVRFRGQSSEVNNHGCISVFNFKESLFSVDGGIQVSNRVLEDFCTF